jgi:hypothetical protein
VHWTVRGVARCCYGGRSSSADGKEIGGGCKFYV